MDTKLFDHVFSHCPQFNRTVVDGVAMEHMKSAEDYIHRSFQFAAKELPNGLVYKGSARCTPQEEFAVATAKRNNKGRSFEMTRTDVYMMKYLFSYLGEDLRPFYLYLPIVGDGGIIKLMGSTFVISPVLVDPAISVGVDNIFIALKMPLTFRRLSHTFVANGQREIAYVPWGNVHNQPKKRGSEAGPRKQAELNATLVHYLFCKYGLSDTFRRFGVSNVVVGTDEINSDNYPEDEWLICNSTGLKPRGFRSVYFPTRLKLAIKKSEYNLTVGSLIGSFFYVVDHFPQGIQAEYIDDKTMWMVLLGHVALESGISEGKMLLSIQAHMASLDGYIDGMSREWLADAGIHVHDVFEFFQYIIINMPEKLANAGSRVASMYGKKAVVNRYCFSDIIHAINKMVFDFQRKANKNNKVLSKKEVIDTMQKYIKTELIIRLNRNHPEVANVNSSTDNKMFKITTNVVMQTSAVGRQRGKPKVSPHDPSKQLHSSLAEIGSINCLPKSEPTGHSRLNPYLKMRPNGIIDRDPTKVELLDRIQESLQGRG